MMNSSWWARNVLLGLAVGLFCLTGCPGPIQEGQKEEAAQGGNGDATAKAANSEGAEKEPARRVATAAAEDVVAAKMRLDELGKGATYQVVPDGVMTAIAIEDGSRLTPDDISLFGKLTDLESLEILNYRGLNDQQVADLSGLENLQTLALTNTGIGDPAVTTIADSFPKLTNLDLSSNTNLTNGALKTISGMTGIDRLTLIQNGFNDLGMSHLLNLENLRVLDIRGNMDAGNLTLEILGMMPKLTALKHRSTAVDDMGLESLSQSESLESLLMQDFNISSQAGQSLAQMEKLVELEVFRCTGFGSDGVLALKRMPLTRLRLRALPAVDDSAMAVFEDLPALERLYLHEIGSISDEGLQSLANLKGLRVLDIWAVPQMGDATVEVIAKLPRLTELSLRETGITNDAVDTLLGISSVKKLTLQDNNSLSDEAIQKLSQRDWTLVTGQ